MTLRGLSRVTITEIGSVTALVSRGVTTTMAILHSSRQADGSMRHGIIAQSAAVPQHPVVDHQTLVFLSDGEDRETLVVTLANGDEIRANGTDISGVRDRLNLH